MKRLPDSLKLILYSMMIATSIGLVVMAVAFSWIQARDYHGGEHHKLRIYGVAAVSIDRSDQLAEKDMGFDIGWLPEDVQVVTKADAIAGQYAHRTIVRGERIAPDSLSKTLVADKKSGVLIVPVTVKTEYVAGLSPGCRVAIVKRDLSTWKQSAPKRGKSDSTGGSECYRVVAMIPSTKDGSSTTLYLEVNATDECPFPSQSDGCRPVICQFD